MSNSNDNTENSSNPSPNPGPSSAVDSLIGEDTTKSTSAGNDDTSSENFIGEAPTIKSNSDNRPKTLIHVENTTVNEIIALTNQNGRENINLSPESQPEILQRVTNPNSERTSRQELTGNETIRAATRASPDRNQTNVVERNVLNNVTVHPSRTNGSNNISTALSQTSPGNDLFRNQTSIQESTSQPTISHPLESTQNQRNTTCTSTRPISNHLSHQNVFERTIADRFFRALSGLDSNVPSPLPPRVIQQPPLQARAPPSYVALSRPNSNVTVEITPAPVPPRIIQGPPPLAGAPPSYSAVMRIGPEEQPFPLRVRPPMRIQPSPPFIAPFPPPSYAEAQGSVGARPLVITAVDEMIWGPDPLSVICPRCAHMVVTSTRSRRSNITHLSALALFLCGCWPCCLLPYCMDYCKNTYHHCPSCQHLLGMYRPW